MTVIDAPARITPEDLLTIPDNSSMELVDGRIVEKNVSIESSRIEFTVSLRFGTYLEAHPVAAAFPASLGYQCFSGDPGKVRKPDTTIVRIERLGELEDPNAGHMPIPPDLAVEVVSPNDLVYDVAEKVREYLEADFPLVWVMYPEDRTLIVHPNGGRPSILTAEDEITAEAALPGFRCRVADLFPKPGPSAKRGR